MTKECRLVDLDVQCNNGKICQKSYEQLISRMMEMM